MIEFVVKLMVLEVEGVSRSILWFGYEWKCLSDAVKATVGILVRIIACRTEAQACASKNSLLSVTDTN